VQITAIQLPSQNENCWLDGVLLAPRALVIYIVAVTGHPRSRSQLLAVLRAHEAELWAGGVETLTLFGSVARGDATSASDVDLAIRPSAGFSLE